MKKKSLYAFLMVSITFFPLRALVAQHTNTGFRKGKIDKTLPTILESDDLHYDEKKEEVSASGNVFLSQGTNLLHTEIASYFQKEDKILAKGKSWIKDEDQNYSFFSYGELTNHMNDGYINDIRLLLTDDSRAAANRAKRYGGRKVIMWQGIYSPCPICRTNPDDVPLWQLKGDKIIHDKEEKVLTYKHAWMEVLGVPIFYTPYFYHPDPSVKRKSGFLIPVYSNSHDLGSSFTLPFYIVTGQTHDVTIVPTYTTEQGVLLSANHRLRLVDGEYDLNGSFAGDTTNQRVGPDGRAEKKNLHARWHVFFDGRYEFSDETLFLLEVKRASDLPYLKRFPIFYSQANAQAALGALRSMIALENYRDTSYGDIRAYLFQAESQHYNPVLLPIASYSYETQPGKYKETLGFEGNFLHLFREHGNAGVWPKGLLRANTSFHGRIPFVSSWGDIWEAKASIRGDWYQIHHFKKVPHPQASTQSYSKIRLYPQSSLTWRYPFVRYFDTAHWIVEPASMIVSSSRGGNSFSIPNEDSPLVQQDYPTLFTGNRYYGFDNIDWGQRVVYGLHNRHYFTEGRKFFIFMGQSMRLDNRRVLPIGSGERRKGSSFVASLVIAPFSWIEGSSRALLSPRHLQIEGAQSLLTLKTSWVTGSLSHTYLIPQRLAGENNQSARLGVSQMTWTFSTAPIYNWKISVTETVNVGKREINLQLNKRERRLLSRAIVATHEHPCIITTLSLIRTEFRDRDLKPDTRVLLQFNLKNLGSIAPITLLGTNSPGNTRP